MFNAMPEFYIDSFVHAGSYATLAASVLHHLNLKGKEHLLSIGSGPGYMETYFAKKVVPKGRVVGIDNAEKMVKKAREVSSAQEAGNVEFRLQDAQQGLPFKDNEFDHAYSVDALHWMDNWKKALDEMVRVVKPGGKVVVVANLLLRNKKLLKEGLFDAVKKKNTKLENISVIQGWDPMDRDEKIRLMFVIRKRGK
jgi:ubiquinone/menaquinone biosynthesis C-methylase UbiE